MATEIEYVNYKDFVAGLETIENPGVDDVTVVSNETDGPRATTINAKSLDTTADESDLNENSSMNIYTASGRKNLPGNVIAKAGDVIALGIESEKIFNRVCSQTFSAEGIESDGILKDFILDLKQGELVNYKLESTGTVSLRIYAIKKLDPLTYTTLDATAKQWVADDDYIMIRVYAVSHTGSYSVSFSYSVNNQGVSLVEGRTANLESSLLSLETKQDADNAVISPYLWSEKYSATVPSSKTGVIKDLPVKLNVGDVVHINVTLSTAYSYVIYLITGSGTSKTLYSGSSTALSLDYVVDSSDYTKLRLYRNSAASSNVDTSFEFSVSAKNDVQSDYRVYSSHYAESGIDKNGVLKDFDVLFKKGELVNYKLESTGTVNLRLYLIKSLSPSVSITIPNDGSKFVVNDDGYIKFRVYAVSHTGSYSVSFDFSINNEGIAAIDERLNVVENRTQYIPVENDLKMCLPEKIYVVNGLPYNLYGESIMLERGVDVDIFTQPRTESNFDADLLQIGKVCKIENLKNCTLRVGFNDYISRNSRLVYKDISVEYNAAPSGTSKTCVIIGDSITNRGSGSFAKAAAESVGASITGVGTMTNYNSFKGEGREGWTWANFIGKSNKVGNNTITVMGSGTSGSLYENPFLRVATSADLENYPDFCFASTGSASEVSYTDDQSQGSYYIFDFDMYLSRFGSVSIDCVTVALGTNDILQDYATADIVKYAGFMIDMIKSAVPDAKIAVLPSPPWGMTYANFGAKVVPYIEAMKTLASSKSVDVVGLWCFMSRCYSFGVDSNEVTEVNASTDSAPYADYVHPNTDNGHVSYMEYAKVLASYVLN